MKVELNINDKVHAYLTAASKEQWAKHDSFTNQDYFKGPLWELMEIFGPAICHGSDEFFTDNRLTIGDVR